MIKPSAFATATSYQLPTPVWSSASLGFVSVIIAAGSLIGWSALIPLSSAVLITGTVVVRDNIKTVQHGEGGIVAQIFVQDGEDVSPGDKLVHLDTSRQENVINTLRPLVVLMGAEQSRLRAELGNAQEVTFPDMWGNVRVSDFPQILEDQREAFVSRKEVLTYKLRALESERALDYALIQGLKGQEASLEARLGLSGEDIIAATELARTGSGTKRSLRDSRAQAAQLTGELSGIRSRLSEINRRIDQSNIESQRVMSSFREADGVELQQLARDEADVIQHLNDATISLGRADIRAPSAGRVSNLMIHTVGGVVGPGMAMLDIVPMDKPLIIEARIRPIDVEDVIVGSTVIIHAESPGAQRMGAASGRVISVSPDRLIDHVRDSAYFLVRIEVDGAKFLAAQGVDLRTGISVEVAIEKKRRTAVEYVLAPIHSALAHMMNE